MQNSETTRTAPVWSWRRRRRVLTWGNALLCALMLLAVGARTRWYATLSNGLNDRLLYGPLFTGYQASGSVVIVAVDDESLTQKGAFGSWPRSWHAQLAANVRQAGARVVVFDMLFSDAKSATEDGATGQGFGAAGNVVVGIAGQGNALLQVNDHTVHYKSVVSSLPAIASQAALAHTNVLPDSDGVVRRMPMTIAGPDDRELPSLGLQALWLFWGLPGSPTLAHNSTKTTLPNNLTLPTDGNGQLVINFAARPAHLQSGVPVGSSISSPGDAFPIYRYADVLDHPTAFPADAFRNKIVLVGSMATAVNDTQLTPVSSRGQFMYGIEIHANTIETIFQQRFVVSQSGASTAFLIVLLALLIGISAERGRPSRIAWNSLALIMVVSLGSIAIFAFRAIQPNIFAPLMTISLTSSTMLLTVANFEVRDKRRILQLFERRTTPQVMKQLLAAHDQGHLQLGGERREASVLFGDIRGYTSISETLSPEDVINVLNAYLSIAADVVLDHGGTICQFAGDQIMAVWNAPVNHADHELSAVRAGLELLAKVAAFQQTPAGQALPMLQFGVSVNTGAVVSGNIGSIQRFDYTVIGDTTNLSARICAGTPGGELHIGPSTAAAVQEHFVLESLGGQTFKGKREPVTIFSVRAPVAQPPAESAAATRSLT